MIPLISAMRVVVGSTVVWVGVGFGRRGVGLGRVDVELDKARDLVVNVVVLGGDVVEGEDKDGNEEEVTHGVEEASAVGRVAEVETTRDEAGGDSGA